MDEIIEHREGTAYYYKIYGIILESNYPIKNLFKISSGPPEITFSCTNTLPFAQVWQKAEPISSIKSQTDDGENLIALYRMNGFDVVHIANSIDFYIWPEKIVAHLLNPQYKHMVEIHFLGWILSIWLELHKIPAIHASAVATKYGAIGFISSSKGGKSALAAVFVRKGYPLLTDDILPIEAGEGSTFFGRPGYPQMRMWPDEAEYFFGKYDDLGLVHPKYLKRRVPIGPSGFGNFCSEKQQIKVLYVPERRSEGADIRIESISPKNALIELVKNSFSARTVAALGLEAQRMKFFARIVLHIPIRRLIYPSGFQYLGEIHDALVKDIESL
ncbi:MAG: hypothetical protein LUQ65_11750 [Candidatus Helarchaeota archaeon]|nr:hypothetical protein [Candidatus Helarchaeota archaeon]